MVRQTQKRWSNFGGFYNECKKGAKIGSSITHGRGCDFIQSTGLVIRMCQDGDRIDEHKVTEPVHPATLGCVALVWMPSAFGMMVRHPMVQGFRLW